MSAKPYLLLRLRGSVIGQPEDTRKTVRGLGLRKTGSKVIVANTPSFRGMVKKVLHLVAVEETAQGPAKRPVAAKK